MRVKKQNQRRVVVTGLGVISSLGIGWEEFWKNLMAGKSGISKITSFDVSKHDRQYGGEVRGFDAKEFIDKRKINTIGRASQMAIAAAKLALRDGQLALNKEICAEMGVFFGTTTGEIGILEKFNKYSAKNFREQFRQNTISFYSANNISSNVARELKLRGQSVVISTACSSGNYALSRAVDLIRDGKQSYALAGGADGFSRVVYTGFCRTYVVAPDKCQPFDKNRKGMIPAEGSGVLLLESLSGALKRKAPIYAEVIGAGFSCDAKHMADPDYRGISRAMTRALVNAGIQANSIDYISAHGTGTPENDRAECKAAKDVWGGALKNIPMSSIKSMLGHTMGAAAALESIACCLIIKNKSIPPTINLVEQDPDCDIDCVPNDSRKHDVKILLNNSQAFGGNNSCVVMAGFNDEE